MKLPLRIRPSLWVLAIASGILHAADPLPVKALSLKRGETLRYVTLPGNLRPNQQATLYAKVAGYVKQVAVDTGDLVRSGQLLAELEVPELQADLKKFEADVAVADLEFQRLSEARKRAPDLVLPQVLDKARATAEVARAGLQRTETLLSFGRITAPFEGVVTARYVDTGSFVPAAGAGSTPQTAAVYTVMDTSRMRTTVAVPELEAVLVQTGQPVKISFEALGAKVWETSVSRTSYAVEETTRTMRVEADLPNPDRVLRPGLYATVRIGVEKHTDTLRAPVECLAMEKTNAFVFKIVDGKLRKTPVTLGFNDGTHVEILSGASEGDSLAATGKLPFTDGQNVQTQPSEAAPAK
jgi:membrane fusion protein (multidrug efflux system)